VTNINVTNILNVYEQRVENVRQNHVSYNGICPRHPHKDSTSRLLAEIQNCGPQRIVGGLPLPPRHGRETFTNTRCQLEKLERLTTARESGREQVRR
jgi:hypothetical protein